MHNASKNTTFSAARIACGVTRPHLLYGSGESLLRKSHHLQPRYRPLLCRNKRRALTAPFVSSLPPAPRRGPPNYYRENLFAIHTRRKPLYAKNDRPAFYRWLDVVGGKNINNITRFRFDVEVCGAKIQLHLLSASPGYEVRKITARTERREMEVRAKLLAVLRPLHEQRTGDAVCVKDIRGFEEALFKWSQSLKDAGGRMRVNR